MCLPCLWLPAPCGVAVMTFLLADDFSVQRIYSTWPLGGLALDWGLLCSFGVSSARGASTDVCGTKMSSSERFPHRPLACTGVRIHHHHRSAKGGCTARSRTVIILCCIPSRTKIHIYHGYHPGPKISTPTETQAYFLAFTDA
jgi:hypothetical protein